MPEKILKVSQKEKRERFAEIGKLVQEGKARFLYYAVDGDNSYFYYLLIN